MNRQEVVRIIKDKDDKLRQRYGVSALILFGSVARDGETSTSDVDSLVEFDRPMGYFGLFALQNYLESLFGCDVDLGTIDSLKPRIRERVLKESVRVTKKLARPD